MYEWNDDKLYPRFNALKKKNPELKTLLAVGGWNHENHNSPFSKMVKTAASRYLSVCLSICLFDYCDIVWSNLNGGLANRLQKLQNRAGCFITQSSYEIRSVELLERLGWDNLATRRLKHKLILM